MELPKTETGNRYVIVLQDFLTKWPLVFPMPDQRTHRVARILVQEVIPLFGVPEALLSDRGTNVLSHLMQDLCTPWHKQVEYDQLSPPVCWYGGEV